MPYISNTDRDREMMLTELGLKSVEELFDDIPADLRPSSFNLPSGLSELEVRRHTRKLAGNNVTDLICFLGGGFYDHFIPAALETIVSRSEFSTSYTPYQPEISQGTLQAIYEYQSAVCMLTEMDVDNASLYDGGTALYEAMMMAVRITRRRKVIVDEGVSPIYRKMLHSYTGNLDLEFVEVPIASDGRPDRKAIETKLDDNTACLILQNPNFFGCVDDLTDLAEAAHGVGSLAILSTYPISLGILKTPGEMQDVSSGKVIENDRWAVTAAPAKHVEPWLKSLAYRVDLDEGSVMFAGDTGLCEPVSKLASNADILVVNCWDYQETMEKNGEAPGQTGTLDAARMARDAGANKLILTHTGPHLSRPDSREKVMEDIASIYQGEIIFGEELMNLVLW